MLSTQRFLNLTAGYSLKYWFVSIDIKGNFKRLIFNYKVFSVGHCNLFSILIFQFVWFCLLDSFTISPLKTWYSGDARQCIWELQSLSSEDWNNRGQWNRNVITRCQWKPKAQLSKEPGKYRNIEDIFFSKIKIVLLFSDNKNDTCSL